MKHPHHFPAEQSIEQPWYRAIFDKLNWPSLFAGAAFGMAGLHLLTTRPLIQEIHQLETRVTAVQSRVQDLTEVAADARQSGSLLGALIDQRSQVESARLSLSQIDALSSDVAAQSQRAVAAGEALGEISDLNSRLIATRDQRDLMHSALTEVETLHQDIAALGQAATAGMARIADADAALAQLADLNERVATASGRIDAACVALDGLQRVQDRLIGAGDQAEAAHSSAASLVMLQDTIAGAGQIDAAAQNAEQLIELQDALVADQRLHLEQASRNIDELIRLQSAIAGQTEQIADSIDSLELLSDFQSEFHGEVSQLEGLRRQMMELILLETTISRALKTLEPLTELSNLRRLDDDEVRSIARDILDRRRDRTASGPSKYETDAPQIDGSAVDILVPEPPVEE